MRTSYLAVVCGALALFWSLEASANGRFPQSNQILFSPSDPNLIVARTTYGILPSHDNGKTWSFVCEDALGVGYSATVDPEIGLTGSNAIIGAVVTPPGLSISPDTGCSWNCAGGPLAGQAFIDLAVRLDNPHGVVALTSTSFVDAGAEAWSTQVFQSMDDGATWAALGKPIPDPAFQAQTIEVAKADPQRIYVSGNNGLAPARSATVWTSKDSGSTWTATVLPSPAEFDPSQEDSIYIGAVDPTDANRVYLRSKALPNGGTSRLLMSTDGAATFTELTSFPIGAPQNTSELGEFAGFALSPDGSKIYAGTREKGLFMAQRADTAAAMAFKNISQIHVFCLATRGNELWVCSDAGSTFADLKSQFVIGVTTDDGATFSAKMTAVQCVAGLLDCSGATSTTMGCNATVSGAQCGATFSMWCDQNNDPTAACQCDVGGTDASGGGASDAAAAVEGGTSPAADGGSGAKPGSSSSCGISAVGEPPVAALVASVAAVGLALGRRRRRRRS